MISEFHWLITFVTVHSAKVFDWQLNSILFFSWKILQAAWKGRGKNSFTECLDRFPPLQTHPRSCRSHTPSAWQPLEQCLGQWGRWICCGGTRRRGFRRWGWRWRIGGNREDGGGRAHGRRVRGRWDGSQCSVLLVL